jgi:hypothetical protein
MFFYSLSFSVFLLSPCTTDQWWYAYHSFRDPALDRTYTTSRKLDPYLTSEHIHISSKQSCLPDPHNCQFRKKVELLPSLPVKLKIKALPPRHAGTILVLGTRWGEWSASLHPRSYLTPEDKTQCTHCIGGWLGIRAIIETEARGKILCLCRGSKPGCPFCRQTL